MVARGDWVAAKLRWTGTHPGEFAGAPATGKQISVTELEIVRCEGGRIVELRNVFDIGTLLTQISS